MEIKRCPICNSSEIESTGGALTGNPAHFHYRCEMCLSEFTGNQITKSEIKLTDLTKRDLEIKQIRFENELILIKRNQDKIERKIQQLENREKEKEKSHFPKKLFILGMEALVFVCLMTMILFFSSHF